MFSRPIRTWAIHVKKCAKVWALIINKPFQSQKITERKANSFQCTTRFLQQFRNMKNQRVKDGKGPVDMPSIYSKPAAQSRGQQVRGQRSLTSFWAMPILSLQCTSTRSAFSLANFSTSFAALPARRCHSGTLFLPNWSCRNTVINAFTALKEDICQQQLFIFIPWQSWHCPVCASYRRPSPARGQGCPGTPADPWAEHRHRVKAFCDTFTRNSS